MLAVDVGRCRVVMASLASCSQQLCLYGVLLSLQCCNNLQAGNDSHVYANLISEKSIKRIKGTGSKMGS